MNGSDPTGLFSLSGQISVSGITGQLRAQGQRAVVYAGKQAFWSAVETGIELVIGRLLETVTGIRFDVTRSLVQRSFLTNFASNLATSRLGAANRWRKWIDFSIRMVSDVAFGGEHILWAAAANLGSLAASELLANYGAKILGHCIAKYGGCFEAGTPVVTSCLDDFSEDDSAQTTVVGTRTTLTKPIETVSLGNRVVTDAPDTLHHESEFGEPDSKTWAQITILQHRSDGTEIEMQLLRPNWWITRLGLHVGHTFSFNLPELRTSGRAKVLSIDDCPLIEDGAGEVVIGRFVTRAATNIIRVTLDDGTEITGTTNHPVWSVDVAAWIPLAKFTPGDRVLTLDGEAMVTSLSSVNTARDVFNIEVDRDHVYRIAHNGVLVHNANYFGAADSAIAQSLARLKSIPWYKFCENGCEKVAKKIFKRIGGDVFEIRPQPGMGFGLGRRGIHQTRWEHHRYVLHNGRAYDALTGPEGLPYDLYVRQFEMWEYLDFKIIPTD